MGMNQFDLKTLSFFLNTLWILYKIIIKLVIYGTKYSTTCFERHLWLGKMNFLSIFHISLQNVATYPFHPRKYKHLKTTSMSLCNMCSTLRKECPIFWGNKNQSRHLLDTSQINLRGMIVLLILRSYITFLCFLHTNQL